MLIISACFWRFRVLVIQCYLPGYNIISFKAINSSKFNLENVQFHEILSYYQRCFREKFRNFKNESLQMFYFTDFEFAPQTVLVLRKYLVIPQAGPFISFLAVDWAYI